MDGVITVYLNEQFHKMPVIIVRWRMHRWQR